MLFQKHIPLNRRGLVFKNGDFKRLLLPGSHFLFPGENLHLFDIMLSFEPPIELNLLLKDPTLNVNLEIVEVLQNEILLVSQDGICKQLLRPGIYAYWKGATQWTFRKFDLTEPRIPEDLDRQILQLPHVSEHIITYTISPNHKGALYINQKFIGSLDSGNYYFWKSAISVEVVSIDLRLQQKEISGQEMLTKDKIMLRLNFVFQYKVIDPMVLLNDITNLDEQLHVIFQLALREYIGNLTLDEILQKKEEIGNFVLEKVNPRLKSLGIEVHGSGVKDVILPGEIKDIINQVLIAEKKAQANVITRREETASTRNFLNTAKLMEENPILFKLKELEYLERLTEKVNEINVNGSERILDQLRNILMSPK